MSNCVNNESLRVAELVSESICSGIANRNDTNTDANLISDEKTISLETVEEHEVAAQIMNKAEVNAVYESMTVPEKIVDERDVGSQRLKKSEVNISLKKTISVEAVANREVVSQALREPEVHAVSEAEKTISEETVEEHEVVSQTINVNKAQLNVICESISEEKIKDGEDAVETLICIKTDQRLSKLATLNNEYKNKIRGLENTLEKQLKEILELKKLYKILSREYELSRNAHRKDYFALKALEKELAQIEKVKVKSSGAKMNWLPSWHK